jgi:hypothetical protein
MNPKPRSSFHSAIVPLKRIASVPDTNRYIVA